MPIETGGPARKPTNRGLRKSIGFFVSRKLGALVPFEGALEFDFIHWLEYNDQVMWYQAQPVMIQYRHWPNGDVRLEEEVQRLLQSGDNLPPGGRRTRYHPDFLVEFRCARPWLVEVKSSELLKDPDVKRKRVAGDLYAELKGWEFKFATEQIRVGSFLGNSKLIHRYSHMVLPPEVQAQIQQILTTTTSPLSIRGLAALLDLGADARISEACVFAAVAANLAVVDLHSAPVGPHTTVSVPGIVGQSRVS